MPALLNCQESQELCFERNNFLETGGKNLAFFNFEFGI